MSPGANHPSPWMLAGHPASPGDPRSLVTLVDGQTFCLSSRSGDFDTNPTHGVFFADMRVLSQARLTIGGAASEPLAVDRPDARSATFVGRCQPVGSHDMLLVIRRRQIGEVWRERIEVRNTSGSSITAPIELAVAADLADLFAVKEGRDEAEGQHTVGVGTNSLHFRWRHGTVNRQAELRVSAPSDEVTANGFGWTVDIPSGGTWTVQLELSVAIGSVWVERVHHHPEMQLDCSDDDRWLESRPRLRGGDPRWLSAFHTGLRDLASLRLLDPAGTRLAVVAAGAPWYMTLFGRDALITAYMALPIDRRLALGVLDALAELQGTRVDPATEEQPGRIVHETRYLGIERVTLTGHSMYYGSADATPLFVVLLGEALRWGLDDADLHRLLPHADRALRWIDEYGDADGDGYVTYLRSSEHGLVNQGWKDSGDAIRYHDGRVAEAPLALCEVQAYVYAAFRARASIAHHLGDASGRRFWLRRSRRLKERFNRDFWLPDRGWFAVALDAAGQPVDSLTSNIGHCLWAGIVEREYAGDVAERLMSPQMWTGWGIRTLASDEPSYDPTSYHRGSVWPHDSAICAAGLAHYGHAEAAARIADGLLDAAAHWDGRLPEFFCGLDRGDVRVPVPFPTSCSPQAWAAAAPFLLLRTLLGLEPNRLHGLTLSPVAGAFQEPATLSGVESRGRQFDVRITPARARVLVR